LKLQLQAEQLVQKARHSWGNVSLGDQKTASPGFHQFKEGRSVERSFLLLDDRLTARPKHSDFRERIFLRGKIKERRSSVESEKSRRKRAIVLEAKKALQAFRDPGSMTEGARSFRRRGTFAHRSPWSLVKSQDVGPAKSGQLSEAKAKVLHLEVSTRADLENVNSASRSTDIVLGGELQLLDVIVCLT
jgi:hypothetical protein